MSTAVFFTAVTRYPSVSLQARPLTRSHRRMICSQVCCTASSAAVRSPSTRTATAYSFFS